MQLKIKTIAMVISALAMLVSASCSPSPTSPPVATEAVVTATPAPSQPILKTSMGEYVIASSRLVDEVHDSKAPAGKKFLLIGLAQTDLHKLSPGEFSLETFQKMMLENQNDIYIQGKDDSQSYSSQMAGWVEDDFVVGFTVPLTEAYTLYWPGNAPIPLQLEQ